MRVLIRNLDTGLVYRAPQQWVQSAFEATDFQDAEAAQQTGVTLPETNLEIFVVDSAGRPLWGRRLEK